MIGKLAGKETCKGNRWLLVLPEIKRWFTISHQGFIFDPSLAPIPPQLWINKDYIKDQ
jgi:hypothetical protein